MPYVKFYKLQNDGSQTEMATCKLSAISMVVCDGPEVFVKNLAEQGIKNYDDPDGSGLFFKDGLKFLEQLKFNFTSGYLNASDVIED